MPEREVQYSHIDPVAACRELFIRRALVEGDFETRHAFFRQNLRMLAEVEELENKSRRRDILVDDQTLFAFMTNACHMTSSGTPFDRWWQKASKQDAELLNFEREMLMKGDASHVNELDYSNLASGRLKLRLSTSLSRVTRRTG